MSGHSSRHIGPRGFKLFGREPRKEKVSGTRRRRRAFAGLVETLENRELLSLSGGGGLFMIVPKVATGSALTVPPPSSAGSSSDGTQTTISAQTGAPNQLWSVQDNGDGTYSIIPAVAPGLSLDERNGGGFTSDGTAAQVYHANGTDPQRWGITDLGNGYDQVTPVSGVVATFHAGVTYYNLDVTNGNTADGTPVQLYHSNTGSHTDGTLTDTQQWQFVRVSNPDNGIVSGGIYSLTPKVNTNSALDVPGLSASDGTQLEIYRQNAGGNQLWRVTRNSDGTYVLSPLHTPGKALDDAGGSGSDGTHAQQYSANGTKSQNWQITPTGGGFFMLAPQGNPSDNLDVTNGSSTDGTLVQIYHRNSGSHLNGQISDSQQWLFEQVDAGIVSGQTYQLVPKVALDNGKDEALAASNTNSGSQVTIQTRDQTQTDQSQIWTITQNAQGYYSLVPQNATNESLDKSGAGYDATYAQVYTTNNGSAQQWWIAPLRNSPYVKLSPASTPYYNLDVTNGSTTPNTGVQVYHENSGSGTQDGTGITNTQEWLLLPTQHQFPSPITTDQSEQGLPDYTSLATLAKRAAPPSGGSSSSSTYTPPTLDVNHLIQPRVLFAGGLPVGTAGFHYARLQLTVAQIAPNPSGPQSLARVDTRYLPDGSAVYNATYTYRFQDPRTKCVYILPQRFSTFFPDNWTLPQIQEAANRAFQTRYSSDTDPYDPSRIVWSGVDTVNNLRIRGVLDTRRNIFVSVYPLLDGLPTTPPSTTPTPLPTVLPPSSGSGGTGVVIIPGHDPGELRLVLDDINGLNPASTTVVPLTVDLGGQSLQDVTFAAPSGVSVELTDGVFLGGSPSLIVQSGNLTVSDSTLSNATSAPTIVVQGGSLALRNDSIGATSGSSPEAILLSGGSLDLGTSTSPGGNTIVLNGPGQPVMNIGSNPESDAGNSFVVNGLPLPSTSLSFTSLTSSLANPVYGQMMTLTASVSGGTAGGAAPTGSVAFFDTSTNSDLGTVMLTGGVAQLMASALTAGGHTIQARYSGDPGYCFSQGSMTEIVAPAPLTVTAVGTKVYGQSSGDAILTPSYSGFVNNESTAILGGAPALVNAVGATADVGSYPGAIAVGSGTLVAANYYFVLQAGTLMVNPAPLVVTAGSATRYYGDPNPTFTGSIAGIQNNDAITASYGTVATPASDAATYSITPLVSGDKLFDYAVKLVNGNLSIQQAPSSLTNLSAPTIVYRTTSTTLSGKVSYHTVAPPVGEVVTISLNGVSRLATITDARGDFSAPLPTGALAAGTYTVTYSYGGDHNFQAIVGTTSLKVTYATTILTDLSKPENGGSTLPIKLQVDDVFGNDVSSASLAVTVLGIAPATNPAGIMMPTAPGASFPGGEFQYDPTTGSYQYNLKLVDSTGKRLASGTYDLYYSIGTDPVMHMLQFIVT